MASSSPFIIISPMLDAAGMNLSVTPWGASNPTAPACEYSGVRSIHSSAVRRAGRA